MCVLPDGRIVSDSRDLTLRVWDTATGSCERLLSLNDSDRHEFQQALDASYGMSNSAIVGGSSVSVTSSFSFVCESPITHSYITAAGLVFCFCDSGRLHVFRRISAAASC